jgi:two-component system response regulator YesN
VVTRHPLSDTDIGHGGWPIVVDPRPSILVVDDEAAIREAIAAALAGCWVVYAVASGDEACALLQGHAMAVIILDLVLRNEYGLDLVARFRRLSLSPILVLTGHSSEEAAIRAVRAGVQDYLKKPFSLGDLEAALRRLVPWPESTAALAARARRALDAYLPTPFRAATLASQLGVTERHLRRAFLSIHGKTPRRYLTDLRMARAATLLRTSPLPIEQIAWDLGYLSATRFGRVFHRAFQMSPSDYRTQESAKTS